MVETRDLKKKNFSFSNKKWHDLYNDEHAIIAEQIIGDRCV